MIINFNKKLFNKKYIENIEKAYEEALKVLKIKCHDLEVNIKFVSKSEIKELNTKFRNNENVTDVLSFPNLLEVGKKDMQLITQNLSKQNFKSEINPETNMIFLGDIVHKHSKLYGTTKMREMVYMAVHGLLHLLGFDHMKDEDKIVMREAEEKIMKKVNLERV